MSMYSITFNESSLDHVSKILSTEAQFITKSDFSQNPIEKHTYLEQRSESYVILIFLLAILLLV